MSGLSDCWLLIYGLIHPDQEASQPASQPASPFLFFFLDSCFFLPFASIHRSPCKTFVAQFDPSIHLSIHGASKEAAIRFRNFNFRSCHDLGFNSKKQFVPSPAELFFLELVVIPRRFRRPLPVGFFQMEHLS